MVVIWPLTRIGLSILTSRSYILIRTRIAKYLAPSGSWGMLTKGLSQKVRCFIRVYHFMTCPLFPEGVAQPTMSHVHNHRANKQLSQYSDLSSLDSWSVPCCVIPLILIPTQLFSLVFGWLYNLSSKWGHYWALVITMLGKKPALSEWEFSSPDLLLMGSRRPGEAWLMGVGARTHQVSGGPHWGYPTSLLLCPASPFPHFASG